MCLFMCEAQINCAKLEAVLQVPATDHQQHGMTCSLCIRSGRRSWGVSKQQECLLAGQLMKINQQDLEALRTVWNEQKLLLQVREKKNENKSRQRFWEVAGSKMGQVTGGCPCGCLSGGGAWPGAGLIQETEACRLLIGTRLPIVCPSQLPCCSLFRESLPSQMLATTWHTCTHGGVMKAPALCSQVAVRQAVQHTAHQHCIAQQYKVLALQA